MALILLYNIYEHSIVNESPVSIEAICFHDIHSIYLLKRDGKKQEVFKWLQKE